MFVKLLIDCFPFYRTLSVSCAALLDLIFLFLFREMNILDNNQRAIGVDSLINAETVKYFSMEDYEVKV